MKIKGVYILSRRSIARMLATITAALMFFCTAATAKAETTVRRIHDATISLVSLDRQMVGRTVRTVVPEIMYQECQSLYLEVRRFALKQCDLSRPGVECAPSDAAHPEAAPYHVGDGRAGRPRPAGSARSANAPYQTAATPRPRNSRRGSGLKGKRTERMVEQLAEFTAWLRSNPINERDLAHTVGARASQFWRLREKTFKRDVLRVGERRGFGSEKTLASAFRNSKA